MRVFVTGASGWIGSALVPDLLAAGHQVIGLARSDAAADTIAATGAEVLRGDVQDLDALRAGASNADAVAHLAFRHDIAFTGDFAGATASDRAAIETFGDVLAGTDRPLVIAAGLAGIAPGKVATERDRAEPHPGNAGRADNETLTLSLVERGVRAASIRLAPTVHGKGDNGFLPRVVAADREHDKAAYIGDGANRWAAVHRSDAATLFRLALESAPAGSVLHGVAEEGVALRDVAQVIGRHLDVPVESITIDQAGDQFGFLAGFLAGDIPASSAITRELLGWTPTGPGLLEDLAENYFG